MKALDWWGMALQQCGSAVIGFGVSYTIINAGIAFPTILVGLVTCIFGWQMDRRITDSTVVKTVKLRKHKAEQRKILILFLSLERGSSPVQLTGNLGNDLRSLAQWKKQNTSNGLSPNLWSWEQPLRAIYHQIENEGTLSRLILIGSPESVVEISDFVRLLQIYPQFQGNVPQIRTQTYAAVLKNLVPAGSHSSENGTDFEDFDRLTESLERVLKILKTDQKVPGDDIMIDFTGGQKVASVVATSATLFSNVSNQYVATNPRDRTASVWEYDVWGYELIQQKLPND